MKQNLWLRIIVTIVTLLAAAAHIWKPGLKIDSITVLLLVICVLPWAQPLIKSIELLGVKLELQELQSKVAEAKGAAESASRQAVFALSASSAPPTSPKITSATAHSAEIQALAREYEEIRKNQPSGDARTEAMTDVVRRMISVARFTESFEVDDTLRTDSSGTRLFAYAYLYARPDARYLLPLVESVTEKEDNPFGQYWGLQSLGRVLSEATRVPQDAKRKLQVFETKVPSGTDREYELKKLLRQVARMG